MRKTTKVLTVLLAITVLLSVGSYFIPAGQAKTPQKVDFPQIALAPKDVTLSIAGDDRAEIGGSINVAVVLKNTANSEVSALEFVLTYDKDTFTEPKIKEGTILKQVQKEAVSEIFPEEGTIKVVIFGLNQNSIKDGKVLEASFKIKSNARPTKASLVIDDMIGASPDAKVVNIAAKSKDIDII